MDSQNIVLFPVDIRLGLLKNSVKAVKSNEDSSSHRVISEDLIVWNIKPCKVVVIGDRDESFARLDSSTRLGPLDCARRSCRETSRLLRLLRNLDGITSKVSVAYSRVTDVSTDV